MKPIKQYKFLRAGLKSENGDFKWKLNKWEKIEGNLNMCHNGFHSCVEPYDAFSYVQGEIVAIVECRGKHLEEDNRFCWEEQRVIKTYKWTKRDSVRLAIYSAELCLPNYEKKYKDKAPRLAIEAAKKWLKTGSKKGLSVAESAARSAAESAAESAARSAAWSARSAAWSAESAAWSAAWSARSVAESVAESATIKKIQTYFRKIVEEKK
jgi:hypothetical protein